MQLPRLLCIFVVLLFLASCNRNSTGSKDAEQLAAENAKLRKELDAAKGIKPPPAPNITAAAKAPTDNRGEVLVQAETEWAKIWVNDGDTWIARSKDKSYLMQIKGRRVEVQANTLNEADRLNEVQWRGSVAFYRSAQRLFGFGSNEGSLSMNQHQAGWNEWSSQNSAVAVYSFKKQRGTWSLQESGLNEYAQLDFGRDDMARPSSADLAAAGIKTSSQDSSEEIAFEAQKKNFLAWLRAYFAKGKARKGEEKGGYHAGNVPYTFTLTMTADPAIQVYGPRDSKVKFKAFARLHWHGRFNNGQGTSDHPAVYVDADRVMLRSDEIDLSKVPFEGSFKWVFIDEAGKEWDAREYSSIVRGCGFQKNGYTMEPVVGEAGGSCDDSAVTAATIAQTHEAAESLPDQSITQAPDPSPRSSPLQNSTGPIMTHSVQSSSPAPDLARTQEAPSDFAGEHFPETRTRELKPSDIQVWSDAKLQYAINEMFARHGAEFGNPATAKWFKQFPWYKPRPESTFDSIEASMTEIERQNLKLLGEYRTAKRNQIKQPTATARNPPGNRSRYKREQARPDSVGRRLLESILQGVADGLEGRR